MTLFGPDGSHWQAGMVASEADWDAIGFAIWRASIGNEPDETYATWREAAKAHDVPFVAYHFVYHTTSDPAVSDVAIPASSQAAVFARAEPDRSVPAMLDWERRDKTLSDGRRVTRTAPTFDHVLQVAAALRGLGYRVPLLYTGKWYWELKGRPVLSGHGFELVNANYGTQTAPTYTAAARYAELGGDASVRWATYGGLTPSIWQFSDRVVWGDRAMDANAVRDHAVVGRCFKDWTPPPLDDDLYPHGYAGATLTLAQIEAKQTVAKLHPEMWRRYRALMVEAKSQGVALGVGTGWRVQPVNPDGTPKPGFALPGNSNHEGFPADGVTGGAVAIDTVPAESWKWMEANLAAYGLRSFHQPSSWGYKGKQEDWHIQPVEIPASRNRRVTPWKLPEFALPPPPEDDDMTEEQMNELVDRVADKVWQRSMLFKPTNKQMPAEDLLEWTCAYAANADMNTRPPAGA